jgi:hypothetical protein
MENIEENSEKIWKLWKKDKFNSETIWKIQKKIVKRYGRKVSWIVKRFRKYRRQLWKDMKIMLNSVWYAHYGRKASWIVKRFGK